MTGRKVVKTPAAEHLEIEGIELERHPDNESLYFPDGEVYVQLEDLETAEKATVIHSGAPQPNAGLMQLYGVLELLKRREVETRVVLTYFPYSRQDQEFYPGSLNYARAILEKLEQFYGVGEIYTVDAHCSHRNWFQGTGVENLHAYPLVEEKVEMDDFVVLGPDRGAAERFGIPGFRKHRESSSEVEIESDVKVEGRKVLVFDDMVATGETMVETCRELRQQGAERVEAAAVHGVMPQGVERVEQEYDRLYLTNTVDQRESNVRIEPLVSRTID